MHLKLFEVAGTHLFSMSSIVIVLFFVFAIIVVGYLLGKITIKGVSLGTAAIFLVALFVGHFKGVAFGDNGIAAWVADTEAVDAVNFYFKLIQSFGLILFVTSVGLIAGPTFFKNLKKNAKSYVLLGAVIILSGAAVCAAGSGNELGNERWPAVRCADQYAGICRCTGGHRREQSGL